MKPSWRAALNGGKVHLDGSTCTVSVWPMIITGRFDPSPFSRAIRLALAGSLANTETGMPSDSRTPRRYSTALVSLPGGSVVSIRTSAWKWRNASSLGVVQLGGCAASGREARAISQAGGVRAMTDCTFYGAKVMPSNPQLRDEPRPGLCLRLQSKPLARIELRGRQSCELPIENRELKDRRLWK